MATFLNFTLEVEEKPAFSPLDTGAMPQKSTRQGSFIPTDSAEDPKL
jgi:hypothetical protein